MTAAQKDYLRAAGLALISWGLYLGFLSKAYVFEGLIRAMPIETGRWVHLFPGNYLLYGPLGLLFHGFLQLIGFSHPAVISLQIMDTLIGAIGISVFYLLLRRLEGEVFQSLCWTMVLACSLGYWSWSTDAEDYILSTVLLMTNFYVLVGYARAKKGNLVGMGALYGLAILGHIVNGLFALVVLWFFYRVHGKGWLRPAIRYVGAAAIVAVGAYAGVVFLIQKPDTWQQAVSWFFGSAGAWGGFQLDSGHSWVKFKQWAAMSLRIMGSLQPPYQSPSPWPIASVVLMGVWFLLAFFVLLMVTRIKELYRHNPVVVGGCLIWLFAYAVLFTRWQPHMMVYRVSDLVPLVTLLFLAAQRIPMKPRGWQGASLLLAMGLVVGNLGAEIWPRSHASNNPALKRMEFLKLHTPSGSWITGDGGQDEIYIPYFAQRRPLVIGRFQQEPERLRTFIDAVQTNGDAVYVTSSVISAERWRDFFKRYELRLVATGPEGFTLYRVTRYHA